MAMEITHNLKHEESVHEFPINSPIAAFKGCCPIGPFFLIPLVHRNSVGVAVAELHCARSEYMAGKHRK